MPRTSTTRPKGNGPGKGDGWGGPAKGASTSRIKPGDPDGIQALSNDAEIKARRERRLALVEDKIFDLSQNAEREETQLTAAVAYRNQILGNPMQRQDVTSNGEKIAPLVVEIVRFGTDKAPE